MLRWPLPRDEPTGTDGSWKHQIEFHRISQIIPCYWRPGVVLFQKLPKFFHPIVINLSRKKTMSLNTTLPPWCLLLFKNITQLLQALYHINNTLMNSPLTYLYKNHITWPITLSYSCLFSSSSFLSANSFSRCPSLNKQTRSQNQSH